MSRTARRFTMLGIALVVVGGVAWGWLSWGRSRGSSELRFETTKVEKGRIVARVTATGTLSAIVTVQVGSQVSGRISALNADFNSPVKKGQVIARIDPQLFQAAVEQARANLIAAQGSVARAKAQAADAERQLVRSRTLAEQKLVAQADLDTAEANAQAARAQVAVNQGAYEQSRASLHQAEINLNYTTIVSPIAGTVISRNVDVGQTVAASLQAPTLFTIAEDLRMMQVDTNVAESDVGKLKPGMAATFTVDAYPGEKFKGAVRQIRNAPQSVQNVVTYDAVVDVKNDELRLKPGMTATVSFVYAERDDAIRVPNAALRFRPPAELVDGTATGGGGGGSKKWSRGDGGAPIAAGGGGGRNRPPPDQRTVWVMRGLRPSPVVVKTGVSDGTLTEIVEGDVKEGDLAVTDASGGKAPAAGGAPGAPPGGMRRMF